MTLEEAKQMLAIAPARTDKPSAVYPSFTQAQAVAIVANAMDAKACAADGNLLPIYEKRVLQVCRNQRRPKMRATV